MIELKGNKWIDLSRVNEPVMPADPALKLPENVFFSRVGNGDQLHNLEVVSYCPHTGTHIDAPFHVCNEWKSLEKVDPTVLMGPAVVITLHVPEYDYAITRKDIEDWERENEPIREHDAVLFHTGHADKWDGGNATYIDKGYIRLDMSAAEYMVEKKVRFVGLESISVDGAGTECHKKLLGNGTFIVENLCRLEEIGAMRCTTVGTFPAVKGASGTWVRLLALV